MEGKVCVHGAERLWCNCILVSQHCMLHAKHVHVHVLFTAITCICTCICTCTCTAFLQTCTCTMHDNMHWLYTQSQTMHFFVQCMRPPATPHWLYIYTIRRAVTHCTHKTVCVQWRDRIWGINMDTVATSIVASQLHARSVVCAYKDRDTNCSRASV